MKSRSTNQDSQSNGSPAPNPPTESTENNSGNEQNFDDAMSASATWLPSPIQGSSGMQSSFTDDLAMASDPSFMAQFDDQSLNMAAMDWSDQADTADVSLRRSLDMLPHSRDFAKVSPSLIRSVGPLGVQQQDMMRISRTSGHGTPYQLGQNVLSSASAPGRITPNLPRIYPDVQDEVEEDMEDVQDSSSESITHSRSSTAITSDLTQNSSLQSHRAATTVRRKTVGTQGGGGGRGDRLPTTAALPGVEESEVRRAQTPNSPRTPQVAN